MIRNSERVIIKKDEEKNMKKIGKKAIIGICAGAALLVAVVAVIAIMVFRIDAVRAQNIALSQTGGGEIVEQDISQEGLWNEYSYTIVNGDKWYEVEIGGFGGVEGFESGTGNGYMY